MNKRDAEKCRKILNEERRKLVDQLRNIEKDVLKKSQRDATGDLSGYSMHMADVGTDNFDREISLSQATNEQRIIYEIDEALKRINEGSFGTCETCGKVIRKERLRVVPYARFCIQCQAEEESKPKPPAGP